MQSYDYFLKPARVVAKYEQFCRQLLCKREESNLLELREVPVVKTQKTLSSQKVT